VCVQRRSRRALAQHESATRKARHTLLRFAAAVV